MQVLYILNANSRQSLKTICPFQLQIVRLKYFNNDSEIWHNVITPKIR